jgi:hypothetical protein
MVMSETGKPDCGRRRSQDEKDGVENLAEISSHRHKLRRLAFGRKLPDATTRVLLRQNGRAIT